MLKQITLTDSVLIFLPPSQLKWEIVVSRDTFK